MRFDEAVSVLKKIYEEMAQRQEAGQAALLFGLYFAEEIKAMNYGALCKSAGISESYATEMRRGVKIFPYIELNPYYKKRFLNYTG